MALKPDFSFQLAQFIQVFSLKLAPFCKLSVGLDSTNKSGISLSLRLSLCPFLCLSFYKKLSGRSGTNCFLSPVLSCYNRSLDTRFFQKKSADQLPRRGVLLMPSAIPCSLSLLLSRVYSCLFLDWRRTVSFNFFDTKIPVISTEKHVLTRLARFVLCRLCCSKYSLVLSFYPIRIARIENPSCSSCGHPSQDTSHLIQHCPATDSLRCSLWQLFVSLQSRVQALGSWLWFSMVFCDTTIPRKGLGSNNKARFTKCICKHKTHRYIQLQWYLRIRI